MNTEKDQIIQRTDIILANNGQATWDLKADGQIFGSYHGTFTFKCYLSPLQKIAANREYRDLLGSNISFAPENESFLAYALTQLKYRIVSAPPFWSSQNPSSLDGNIADEEIITQILDAALAAELKYRDHNSKKKASHIQSAKAKAESLLSETKEDDDKEDGDLDGDEDL